MKVFLGLVEINLFLSVSICNWPGIKNSDFFFFSGYAMSDYDHRKSWKLNFQGNDDDLSNFFFFSFLLKLYLYLEKNLFWSNWDFLILKIYNFETCTPTKIIFSKKLEVFGITRAVILYKKGNKISWLKILYWIILITFFKNKLNRWQDLFKIFQ